MAWVEVGVRKFLRHLIRTMVITAISALIAGGVGYLGGGASMAVLFAGIASPLSFMFVLFFGGELPAANGEASGGVSTPDL